MSISATRMTLIITMMRKASLFSGVGILTKLNKSNSDKHIMSFTYSVYFTAT